MNLNQISQIKKELHQELKNKEILDIIVFGSAVKGKVNPNDIDIAIITSKSSTIKKDNFHISILKPEDFFLNPPSIVTTLLKEGFSLKNNKFLSEVYEFSNKILFKYELTNKNASEKVRIVYILHGKKNQIGLVEQNKGKWLTNQVFTVTPENQYLFEKFFQNFNINYTKNHILMH